MMIPLKKFGYCPMGRAGCLLLVWGVLLTAQSALAYPPPPGHGGGGKKSVGACCLDDGATCQEEPTEADCVALGGDYQGGGTACEPGSCFGPAASTITIGNIWTTRPVQHRKLFRNPRSPTDLYVAFPHVPHPRDGFVELHRWTDDGESWELASSLEFARYLLDVSISQGDGLLRGHVVLANFYTTGIHYMEFLIHDNRSTEWRDVGNYVTEGSSSYPKIVRLPNGHLLCLFGSRTKVGGNRYLHLSARGSVAEDIADPTWGDHFYIYENSHSPITGDGDNRSVYVDLVPFSAAFPDRALFVAQIPDESGPTDYRLVAGTIEWNGVGYVLGDEVTIDGPSPTDNSLFSLVVDANDYAYLAKAAVGAPPVLHATVTSGEADFELSTPIDTVGVTSLSLGLDESTDQLVAFYIDESAPSDIAWATASTLIWTPQPPVNDGNGTMSNVSAASSGSGEGLVIYTEPNTKTVRFLRRPLTP